MSSSPSTVQKSLFARQKAKQSDIPVDDDAGGGDVSEAAGHVDVQVVPVALLFDVVSQGQQFVDQLEADSIA